MLTKIRNTLQRIGEQVRTSPVAGRLIRSAAEQTRESWAKPITSYADVPPVYKDFFAPFLAAGQAFPYTVLTPSYEGFIHRTTEKLICDMGREIYVLERSGNVVEARGYPLEGISYVEVRTILLESRITICGATADGVPATSTFRFNSVTDYLLATVLKTIRRATIGAADADRRSEVAKFDDLLRVNYKFMNYGRRSLLGSEKVVQIILQPEIRASVLTFLGKTYYRTISPTHMSVLTDRELIIIHEEARKSSSDRYGGTWLYIPLHKIETLSVSERDGDLLALSIRLPHNVQLESLYQLSAKQELDQFLARF